MPPIALALALVGLIASSTQRAWSDDDLDGEIFMGTLESDDLADERAWLDPLDAHAGSLGFSLQGAIARWQAPLGPAMRWELALLVHLPLDRLLGMTGTRVSLSNTNERDPAQLGWGSAMKTKSANSANTGRRWGWGTMAALPGVLALGGVAFAKEKPSGGPLATASAVSVSSSGTSGTSGSSGTPGTSATSATASSVVTKASSSTPTVAIAAPTLIPPATLKALVEAAWRTGGLDRDEALTDLASRARSSALAPELRLRAHRTLAYGARVFSTDTLADHTTLSDGTETFLEARMTWRLDRLVFADEEVAIERVKLDRAELKQRVASRIVELTIAWQRARRAAANIDLLPQEREEAAMMALEAILALDAYTSGAATDLLRP